MVARERSGARLSPPSPHCQILGAPAVPVSRLGRRKEGRNPTGSLVPAPVTAQTFPVGAFLEASVPAALPTTRVFAVASYFSSFSYI